MRSIDPGFSGTDPLTQNDVIGIFRDVTAVIRTRTIPNWSRERKMDGDDGCNVQNVDLCLVGNHKMGATKSDRVSPKNALPGPHSRRGLCRDMLDQVFASARMPGFAFSYAAHDAREQSRSPRIVVVFSEYCRLLGSSVPGVHHGQSSADRPYSGGARRFSSSNQLRTRCNWFPPSSSPPSIIRKCSPSAATSYVVAIAAVSAPER